MTTRLLTAPAIVFAIVLLAPNSANTQTFKVEKFDIKGDGGTEERSPRVAFLGVDPRFDGMRGERRFRKMLQSIGL